MLVHNDSEKTAELVMLAKAGKVNVLVEGVSDETTYQRFLDDPPANLLRLRRGRDWVLDAARRLNSSAERLRSSDRRDFVGIVDADDDCPRGTKHQLPKGVLATDLRDLESSIFFSSAGPALLAQLFDPTKIDNFEKRGTKLCDMVLESGAFTGAVRFLATRRGWAIRFNEVKISNCLSSSPLALDKQAYLRQVSEASNNISVDVIRRGSAEVLSSFSREREKLVHGHDLTAFLAALTAHLGVKAQSQTAVELALRTAYQDADFRQSRLWQDLKAREKELGKSFLRKV